MSPLHSYNRLDATSLIAGSCKGRLSSNPNHFILLVGQDMGLHGLRAFPLA